MANVRLVDLAKHYRRGGEVIRALDGVTLDIDKGDRLSDYYPKYYMKRPKFNSSGPVTSWFVLPHPH